jgi:LacI family transcriptional regulator
LEIDVIGIDEREGMIDLVRHLAAAGHRRIGFFGFCRTMSWSRSRLGAYVEALAEMELDYDPESVIEVSLPEALAENLLTNMPVVDKVAARIRHGVKAWVGASENLGYSLCRGVLDRGFQIPQEVAVTGFHQSMGANVYGLPILTTTTSSSEELGAAALRRLVNHIENPDESRRSILLPCTYTQGETTPEVKLPPLEEIEN